MPRQGYDPKKAHEYYERTKRLKGRDKPSPTYRHIQPIRGSRADGSSRIRNRKPSDQAAARDRANATNAAQTRVVSLKSAVSKLTSALTASMTALRQKQQEARESAKETAKKSSDGKSTAEEKAASKKYRDKHQTEIAAKRKKDSPSEASSPSSTGVSSMSVDELQSRVIRIRGALADAKRQLSSAQQQLGQLAHSAITSEPEFDNDFARFRSAERIPFQ